MNDTKHKTTPRTWWRFGFRLRSLFLLTALIACLLGYIMYERHRCHQQQIVAEMLDVDRFLDGPRWLTWDRSISVREGVWKKILGDNRLDQITLVHMNWFYSSVSHRQMYALSHLKNIKHFAMHKSQVEPPGFHYLAAFHELEYISLVETSIEDSDLFYLSGLRKLTVLQLDGSSITDYGALHLANLTNLNKLHLQQTQISDDGVKHLSKLKNLEHLDLSDTLVTEKSLDLLAQHQNLKFLALPPDTFSPKSRTELRKRLPKCDIKFAKN